VFLFLNSIRLSHGITEVQAGTLFEFLEANTPLLYVYKVNGLWLDAAGTLLCQQVKLIHDESNGS